MPHRMYVQVDPITRRYAHMPLGTVDVGGPSADSVIVGGVRVLPDGLSTLGRWPVDVVATGNGWTLYAVGGNGGSGNVAGLVAQWTTGAILTSPDKSWVIATTDPYLVSRLTVPGTGYASITSESNAATEAYRRAAGVNYVAPATWAVAYCANPAILTGALSLSNANGTPIFGSDCLSVAPCPDGKPARKDASGKCTCAPPIVGADCLSVGPCPDGSARVRDSAGICSCNKGIVTAGQVNRLPAMIIGGVAAVTIIGVLAMAPKSKPTMKPNKRRRSLRRNTGKDPQYTLVQIKNDPMIRMVVGNYHVGTPDAEIERHFRERCAKAGYSKSFADKMVKAALFHHHKNRALYTHVMGGTRSRTRKLKSNLVGITANRRRRHRQH